MWGTNVYIDDFDIVGCKRSTYMRIFSHLAYFLMSKCLLTCMFVGVHVVLSKGDVFETFSIRVLAPRQCSRI